MAARKKPRGMTGEEYRALENKTVVKANELITHTEFSLSAQQQKIVLFLIAQIGPQDEDFREYEFSINEFARACGLDHAGGRDYDSIKDALEALADAKITYKGDRWIPVGGGWTTMLRWIEKPYINPEDGKIRIRLDRDMRPFLLHLRSQFTKYELIWTLQLTGRYSIRLYELCCAYQFDKLHPYRRRVSLATLKERLDAVNYARWPDLRRRVLEPAIAEINAKTDLTISYVAMTGPNHTTTDIMFTMQMKGAMERLAMYAKIEREYNLDQLSFWDKLTDPPEAPGAPRIAQSAQEGEE